MGDLTVTLVILGAVWAAVFNVVKVIEIMNAKRDLVLDINQDGERLSKEQKHLLLTHDFLPMWLGVVFFLAIFAGGLCTIPFTLAEKGAHLTRLESWGCLGAGVFSVLVFLVAVVSGGSEFARMKRHIRDSIDPQS